MNRKHFILMGLILLLLTLGSQYGQTLAQVGQRIATMAPVGAAFTYQGSLEDNAAPANGSYDFEFSLYDDATAGTQIGSTVAQTIAVSDGLFTTSLDFGADAFNSEARFLEIDVQLSGGGGFTTLTPRHPITAVPHAIYATKVQPVGNIVVVAKSGGDFTTLSAALASITTASASNPYLIRIAPGVYQEKVNVKDFVDIEGSGQGITILRGLGGVIAPSMSGFSATLRANGPVNAEVRKLTVESDGTGKAYASAIWTSGTTEALRLRHVTITTSGGGTNFSIYNGNGSALTLNNLTIAASGGNNSYGIYNTDASPTMSYISVTAADASDNFGIVNTTSSAPTMNHITVTASGGTNSYGIGNLVSSSPTMQNVAATASGATDLNYGIYNNDTSSPTMGHVTATASGGDDSYGVFNNNGSAPMMNNVTATASVGTNSIGVRNSSSSPMMYKVTATAAGVSVSNGVSNINSAPIMQNVIAIASAALNDNRGVNNQSASSPTMFNVTATAFDGTNSYGIYNGGSSAPTMDNIVATASNGSFNYGIFNDASSPTINNVIATASGGSASYGVFNNSSSAPAIRDATLTGATDSIQNLNSSTAQIANTMLDGSLTGAGTFTCFNAYDTSLTAVTCP
ncbi:MAG: hypothetical protein AAF614_21285 [Chloroflexota bacterium]